MRLAPIVPLLLAACLPASQLTAAPMRVVFITLEFTAGTFSGNGVYATSQVRGAWQLAAQLCSQPDALQQRRP